MANTSVRLEVPEEGVQFIKEERTPGDIKWFNSIWESKMGSAAPSCPRMAPESEDSIGILPSMNWDQIVPTRSCKDELEQNPGIVSTVANVTSMADDCATKAVELQYHDLPVDLEPDETVAILAYTYDNQTDHKSGNLYFEMNNALRQRGLAARKGMLSTWGPYVHYLLRGLNKLPAFVGDVYRGMCGKEQVVREYKKGRPIQWGAFSSCTTTYETTKAFTNQLEGVIFKIALQSGRQISSYSFFPSEDEVLLLCTSKFVVTSEAYLRDGYTMIDLLETTGDIFMS